LTNQEDEKEEEEESEDDGGVGEVASDVDEIFLILEAVQQPPLYMFQLSIMTLMIIPWLK